MRTRDHVPDTRHQSQLYPRHLRAPETAGSTSSLSASKGTTLVCVETGFVLVLETRTTRRREGSCPSARREGGVFRAPQAGSGAHTVGGTGHLLHKRPRQSARAPERGAAGGAAAVHGARGVGRPCSRGTPGGNRRGLHSAGTCPTRLLGQELCVVVHLEMSRCWCVRRWFGEGSVSG